MERSRNIGVVVAVAVEGAEGGRVRAKRKSDFVADS
jgi:hypothetical protein